MMPDQLYRQGCEAYTAMNYVRAEACFRQCLEQFPDNADLRNALGSVLEAQGLLDEASQNLALACQLRPDCAVFHYNFANLLRRQHKRKEAEEAYISALQINSELSEALHGLGSIYLEAGKLEPAEACLQRAVQISPTYIPALYDFGQLRQRLGDPAGAELWYSRCIENDPQHLPALNALGLLRLSQNSVKDARRLFEQALAADPGYLLSRCNLAVLDTWCGRLEEAIGAFNEALELAPCDADLHFNLSLALLAVGNFEDGWREHEWRFLKSNPVAVHHEQIPRWQGESLLGKTILVHAEQGYGDSLQFVRYVQMLAQGGATVLVEGQDRNITPLLSTAGGVSVAVNRGEPLPVSPDFQLPMMSLAAALGKRGWPPPAPPYLYPPSEKTAYWRERISFLQGLKVGIAWAGRPEHQNDTNRSLTPELCNPFAKLEGISWVSLQFGPHCPQPISVPFLDLADSVSDFCDSASLISALDLVITVDSAIVHLAGALGVPAWLLLPWNPDWRWMHNRQDSVWYPSVKIYRQPCPDSWSEVISRVVCDLGGILK